MKMKLLLCIALLLNMIFILNAQFLDLSSLGDNINKQIQGSMDKLHKDLENLNQNLATLGPRINYEVQQSLLPVTLRAKMARGIDGVTVATYGGKYTVLYINGMKYKCTGYIKENECSEKLTTDFNKEENICTQNYFSQMNNYYCFGSNVSFTCYNNVCQCNGGTLYSLENLKSKCGKSYGSNSYVKYVYYPITPENSIPEINQHVHCEEGPNSNKCTWYGSIW